MRKTAEVIPGTLCDFGILFLNFYFIFLILETTYYEIIRVSIVHLCVHYVYCDTFAQLCEPRGRGFTKSIYYYY